MRHISPLTPSQAALAAFVCGVAIVYVSLIPFNFRPMPLESAWESFRQAPFLKLGMSRRADWIANLLIYVPLGLFVAGATYGSARGSQFASLIAAVALGTSLAFGVEFTQLYFPGRTVSLNDIVAAILGSTVGGGLWLFFGHSISLWTRSWHAGGGRRALALLGAYAMFYALLSFFPYDFVVSPDELAAKLAGGRHALFVVPGGCDAVVRCAMKPVVEIAAAVPIGWLLAHWLHERRTRPGLAAIFAVGLGIGALIEIGQLLLVSGTSQGLSVLTRGVGIAAGYSLQGTAIRSARASLLKWARVASLFGLPVYLALIAVASGWPAAPLSFEAVAQRWPSFHWLPFYYHYFVPEAHAMASVLAQLALYAPVGIAAALWAATPRMAPAIGAITAACLALLAELSKAFIPGKHPDVTDLLIGAGGAWLAARLFQILTSERPDESPEGSTASLPPAPPGTSVASQSGRVHGIVFVALLLGVIAVFSLIQWPVARLPLGLLLVAYAAVLSRWPGSWMIVVPACIPVLDLTPLTGRLYWDELDIVLLVTVAVRLAANARPTPAADESVSSRTKLPLPALGLLVCSAVISGAIGLYPLQPLDANAFSSYLSHYNGLRSLKAVGWAMALLALMVWDSADRRGLLERLCLGMAIGGVLAALGVAWERWLFPGLLDFDANFRVGGTFSAMHVGGAYVEAYLVAVFPFVALQAIEARSLIFRALWLAALGLLCYATLVTYSRAGIAALLVGTAVLLVWTVAGRRARASGMRAGSLSRSAMVALVLAIVAVPFVAGRYLEHRIAQSFPDLEVRLAHWHEVVALMDSNPGTMLFGMGIGRFPETYFWSRAEKAAPGSYSLDRGKGQNLFLRLGGGYGLFFDQRVYLEPTEEYTLVLRARSTQRQATLHVALCEKSLLYSAACSWTSVRLGPDWTTQQAAFDASKIDARGLRARPVRLTLHNPRDGTVIYLDDVSVKDSSGHELVRNGDFARGSDFWFFTSDDHLAWHVKNLPLHLFFEQGALGLIAVASLVFTALARLIPDARSSPVAGALIASLAGFLVVGLFDSLIDAPRHLLLFLVLLFMSWFASPRRDLG